MKVRNALKGPIAARSIALVFGTLAGLGGMVHGIGEVLQGNIVPDGVWINSWTQGPIAENMGGEPGITLIPNLLLTGALTMAISLIVIIWAITISKRKYGGWTMILLSIVLLLVGAGIGPPMIGILAGVAGLGTNSSLSWWKDHLSKDLRHLLASLWPWVFGIGAAIGVFLVIGSLVLVYLFDYNNPDLFTNSFFLIVLSMFLMILTGRAYDVEKNQGEQHV